MMTTKFIASAALIVMIVVIFSVRHQAPTNTSATTKPVRAHAQGIRYLPLGDSYTIGQSVPKDQRWPNQLAAKFAADGTKVAIVDNPSVTGYTTQDLIDRELGLVAKLKPSVVSVQIGVNDYVQQVPIETFQKNLTFILDTLQKELPNPGNIFLVTIPDYAKTPTGAQFGDPTAATAAITVFNAFITQQANERKLPLVDIFSISQAVAADPSLTASDGLHPSGKHYAKWADAIYQILKPTKLFQY
jgi:acyl-CoA thioesterase-1